MPCYTQYAGKEQAMMSELVKKYGPEPNEVCVSDTWRKGIAITG